MNTILFRRRWLMVRPWIYDTAVAIGFVLVVVGAMAVLGDLADICTRVGWCA